MDPLVPHGNNGTIRARIGSLFRVLREWSWILVADLFAHFYIYKLSTIIFGMFDTTFDDVIRCISSWIPKRKYSRETQYRDDLLEYLRKELSKPSPWDLGPGKKHKIQKESGRGLADIGIDDKIGIELKYNMNTKAKVDRLFGQIEDYTRSYNDMVILLCGQTNDDRVNYLESKLSSLKSRGDLFREGPRIKIIIK